MRLLVLLSIIFALSVSNQLVGQEATPQDSIMTSVGDRLMMSHLRDGIWSELSKSTAIDSYRRNLQRAHVMRLNELIEQDKNQWSDISAAARAELHAIQSMAESSAKKYKEGIEKYHLSDVEQMIEQLLDQD